jgi:putative FmdB family regulatory protein
VPTYEYACRSCGAHLEVVQSFTDDALTTCGACSGPLRKVFGAVGISFKGSGFYKTDSRKGSSTTSAASGASGDAAGGGADGGTSGSDAKAKEPASTSGASAGDGASGPKATPATPPKPAPTSTT